MDINQGAFNPGGNSAGTPASQQEVQQLKAQVQELQQSIDGMDVTVTPTVGQTITLPDTDKEITVNLMPDSDLNVVTLQMPAESATKTRQRVFIRTSRGIMKILVIGDGRIDNPEVILPAGGSAVFIKAAPGIWARVV